MSKVILVSGGFDPLHKGHLDLLKEAKKMGDHLSVGINSDAWLTRKKGTPFMSQWDRMDMLMELKCVDHVVPFNDDDDTAKDFIEKAIASWGIDHKFVFVNGGDRTEDNIPEMELQEKLEAEKRKVQVVTPMSLGLNLKRLLEKKPKFLLVEYGLTT